MIKSPSLTMAVIQTHIGAVSMVMFKRRKLGVLRILRKERKSYKNTRTTQPSLLDPKKAEGRF